MYISEMEVRRMPLIELFANVSPFSIILFIAGLTLLVVEMFQPGFGFFGILGIIILVCCIFVTAQSVPQAVILTVFFIMLLLILLGIFLFFMSKGKLPNKLVLRDSETKEDGYTGTRDMQEFMGKTGVVTSICRPVGNVDFDGVKLEVVSQGEFIEKGKQVEVIEIEGNRVVVKEKS